MGGRWRSPVLTEEVLFLAVQSPRLRGFLEVIGAVVAPWAPFSDKGLVYWSLDTRAQSVLSIGCGDGIKDRLILRRRNPRLWLVGVDIFEPYLRACARSGAHDELVLANACRLPFESRSFDLVVAAEVVEHLDRDGARHLLLEMERVARRRIIITCPVGYVRQGAYDDNPFQVHRSAYSPAEFRRLGYRVHGVGLRSVWYGGEANLLRSVLTGVSSLLPLAYSFPEVGGAMVCVKDLDG